MLKKLLIIVCICLATGSVAFADFTLSWKNAPIMGVNVDSSVAGQLTIDVASGLITIPQYSGPDPSMKVFSYTPTVCCDGGNLFDPNVSVWAASAVNVDLNSTYSYQGIWSFLGTPSSPAYSFAFPTDIWGQWGFTTAELYSSVTRFWASDAGPWSYTETWTGTSGNDLGASISSTRDFALVATPEPSAVILFGTALLGAFTLIRRKRNA